MSRVDFGAKPWIYPMPVLIVGTYDEKGTPNAMNVSAEESLLTDGHIDPKKLRPMAYDPVNYTYVTWGEVVGKAFSDGRKLV